MSGGEGGGRVHHSAAAADADAAAAAAPVCGSNHIMHTHTPTHTHTYIMNMTAVEYLPVLDTSENVLLASDMRVQSVTIMQWCKVLGDAKCCKVAKNNAPKAQ